MLPVRLGLVVLAEDRGVSRNLSTLATLATQYVGMRTIIFMSFNLARHP
jgi:hypothetical protein